MFEQWRGNLTKIGYPKDKIKFRGYANFGDFMKAMHESKVMYHGQIWMMDYPDSENALQLFYGPNGSPGSNSANYDSPEFDALFAQSAVMQPSPERSEIYRKLNAMLIDDCAVIAGFSSTWFWLWHKNVILYHDNIIHNYLKYVDVVEN